MAPPQTMKAIKTRYKGVAEVDLAAPLPCAFDSIPDTYVLVKTTYVALNPTDWKHIDFAGPLDHTAGCDLAGTVVAVGAGVTKAFAPGDRIAGFSHGVKIGYPHQGAFGEYALLKGDVVMKVPEGISDAEASTVGIGITTVGQGLYQTLGLPFPDGSDAASTGIPKGEPILVYGGSTATGLLALQFAKLSGLKVITACSPKNFETVRSFGADAAFDYSNPEICAKEISEAAGGKLKYVFDCISTPASAQLCSNALSKVGSKDEPQPTYAALGPLELPRDDVKSTYTMAYSVIGESFDFWRGSSKPATPQDFEFGKRFWAAAEKLIAERKVKLFPTVKEGGFEGVLEGLDLLRHNKVSAQKLVYKVE